MLRPEEIVEIRAMAEERLLEVAPVLIPNLVSIIETLQAMITDKDEEIEQLQNLLGDVQSAVFDMVESQAIAAGSHEQFVSRKERDD